MAHQQTLPPAVYQVRGGVPAALSNIVGRTLAKSPAERYPTPREVATALAPFSKGSDLAALCAKAAGRPVPAPGTSEAETAFSLASIRWYIGETVIELCQGDITEQEVDAIVNAANSGLVGGGGVDGAIHRRGGSTIMEETDRRYPNGCPTGSAVISTAGNLNPKHVIHAVGPVWSGGGRGEAEQLAGAYRRSLELAVEYECRSIAMPALSTGAYGYPLELASQLALLTARDFLMQHGRPELVRFVLFGETAYGAFEAVIERFRRLSENQLRRMELQQKLERDQADTS